MTDTHDEDVRLLRDAASCLCDPIEQAALDRILATIDRLKRLNEALLAEHEAWGAYMKARTDSAHDQTSKRKRYLANDARYIASLAHDEAERIRKELGE